MGVVSAHAADGDAWRSLQQSSTSWVDNTYLLELQQGSPISWKVRGFISQGYESSEGRWVSFRRWYSTDWVDARITWMTQLSERTGFIWGFSTGERGEKYEIAPSLKLGFIHQFDLGRNTTLNVRATTVIGGELSEKTCTADYGEIGGVQIVNCRLAANELPPAQTLQYLIREPPYNKDQILVTLMRYF